MDQNPESFQNQPLLEAEMQRIESETAKNEAELTKFTLEAEEVRRRLSQKWYSGGFLIKLVVGGVILSALIANWAIFYFAPMLQTKQINAELDNAKLAKENWTRTQINEQQLQEIERKNSEIERKNSEIDKLTLRMAVLSGSLVNMSKLSAQERAKLQEQVNVLQRDVSQLRLKTIYFDSTSSELRPDAKASLDENFKTLQEFPDIKIRIEAYGDGVMWNISMEHRQHPGFTYQTFFDRDLALGEKRARKAMEYLIEQGISASRIAIIGHPGEPESTRRRCKFIVVKQ